MQQMVEALLSVDHHVTDTDLENVMDVLRHDDYVESFFEIFCFMTTLLTVVAVSGFFKFYF